MASRKEEKERLRAERLEREAQAQAAERRKQLVGYAAGAVLVVAGAIALIVVLLSGDDAGGTSASNRGSETVASDELPEGSVPPVETADLDEAVEEAGCKLEENASEGSEHFEPPDTTEYKANPPTSGDHYTVPAEDGAYPPTDPPPTEALVHSLEHGRIIIQYDPAAPDTVKADLTALFDEDPYHMIITPNDTDMPYDVAATAWTRAVVCPEMNESVFDAIRAFRDEYRDEGPEFIP